MRKILNNPDSLSGEDILPGLTIALFIILQTRLIVQYLMLKAWSSTIRETSGTI